MYSKEENHQFRIDFWTKYGQFMKLIPVALDEKKNWINYKTGISFIQFKMDVDRKRAYIGIEISKQNSAIHQSVWQKFEMLRTILQSYLPEEWYWHAKEKNEHGKIVSKIWTEIEGVSVNRPEDWPTIFSFLKERMMALDNFWMENKELFDEFKTNIL